MDEWPQLQPPKRNSRLRLIVLLITLGLTLAVYFPLRIRDANDQLTASLITRNAERARDALDHGADPDLPIRLPGVGSQPKPRTLMEYVRQILHRSLRPAAYKPKTALMYAADTGEAKIVAELLRHNANVNLRLDSGFSALLYAASRPPSEIVAALLAKGADVQAHTREGTTALMFAAQAGQTENVRLLLAKGADLHAIDLRTQTALFLATEYHREEIIQLLLAAGADGRDLNSAQPSPNTAQILAASTGVRIATINGQTLLGPGGSGIVRVMSPPRQSRAVAPLAFAAKYGSPSLLRFLWERATPSVKQEAGWGLLCNAVRSGQVEPVRFLLNQNVPVNPMPSTTPKTPPSFHIRPGYDPDKVYTPLHYAAALPTPEIAALLIAHGADVNAEDSFGTTPLLAAVSRGQLETLRLLIAHGANVRAAELDSGKNALMRGVYRTEIASVLLDHGLNVNARDRSGRTALMHCQNPKIAALLIARGADVNARDAQGTTALTIMSLSGQADCVALLLKHGANVHTVNQMGETPLSAARLLRSTAIITLLTHAGAKK